jgi:hypothetical protein
MREIERMPRISSVELHGFKTFGEFNKGSVSKKDMFRGHVHFSVNSSLWTTAMERKESQRAATALASDILQLFDETLVTTNGGGWGTHKGETWDVSLLLHVPYESPQQIRNRPSKEQEDGG